MNVYEEGSGTKIYAELNQEAYNLLKWLKGCAASRKDAQPSLRSIHIKGNMLEVTNGFIVARASLDEPIINNITGKPFGDGCYLIDTLTRKLAILIKIDVKYFDTDQIISDSLKRVGTHNVIAFDPGLMTSLTQFFEYVSILIKGKHAPVLVKMTPKTGSLPPGVYSGLLMPVHQPDTAEADIIKSLEVA